MQLEAAATAVSMIAFACFGHIDLLWEGDGLRQVVCLHCLIMAASPASGAPAHHLCHCTHAGHSAHHRHDANGDGQRHLLQEIVDVVPGVLPAPPGLFAPKNADHVSLSWRNGYGVVRAKVDR